MREVCVYCVIAAAVLIVVSTAATLFVMGQPLTCKCGTVKLWTSRVISNENSQQFADPYSFTHIQHGFLFYLAAAIILPQSPVYTRGLASLAVESLWEVVENTDFVINRYREETLSLDYYGDSILNSIGDILFFVVGFAVAARFPTKASVAIFILIDILLLLFIRDSLLLNILMLIYPIGSIKKWQMNRWHI